MYSIVLLIEQVNILLLVILTVILFVKFNSRMHLYLIMLNVAMIVNNVGYQLELSSTSLDGYLNALKFSYAGRIWIGYFLLLFIAELCRVKIPKWINAILVIFYFAMYPIIFQVEKLDLYYTDISFKVVDGFPTIPHGHGPVYWTFMTTIVIMAIFSLFWVIRSFIRAKSSIGKKQMLGVLIALLIEFAFYIIQITGIISITKKFDVTSIGYTLGTLVILITVFKFKLLDTASVAREYVVDEVSACIIAFDREGELQYYNKPTKELFPQIDWKTDCIVDMLDEHIQSNDPINIDDRIYVPNVNKLTRMGEEIGKIYVINDDTIHFKYMEDLKEQKEIADNANKAKSYFLANMSHEIRTPLNAVLGMDEMIIRESSEGEIVGYANDIKASSETLLSLINDILDLSKVEEGKMEIIPTQYEVGTMIYNVVNMVKKRADDKVLWLDINVDSNIPRVLVGDEIRIKQCILNILNNSIKYTEVGRVSLTVSFEQRDGDNIDLTVEVSDTGIGMKQEDLDRLFSPFTRIEEKRNRTIEGTGLGMSITKRLLDLMGSSLQVTSEYGVGSTFTFTISQGVASDEIVGEFDYKDSSLDTEVGTYKESFVAPEAKILVIDDTDINLVVIANLLKQTKIKIDTATSGRKGIELVKNNHYDVIFIDHMMPEMDGIETLHAMNEEGLVDDTICVALTANAISGIREMYIKEGFDDYLSKPINAALLEYRLSEWIPRDKVHFDIEAHAKLEESVIDVIRGIDGISVEEGVENCGSNDSFLSVLKVFHDTAKAKADEIRSFLDSKDIENYTIKVHALKSSARIIGANALSELAKELEVAGNENNLDKIMSKTPKLLEQFLNLDKQLDVLDEGDDEGEDDRKPLDDIMRKDAYENMAQIVDMMDYGMMDSLLSDLKNYKMMPEDEERIKRIDALFLELDWDGIKEELNKIE